jgi:hypothetical protein
VTEIKNTLYAKYIYAKEGTEVIEDELGFYIYKVLGKECYIADAYTVPEARCSGQTRKRTEQLEKIAKARGCDFISAKIYIADADASNTLMAALRIGFRIATADARNLIIVKDIKGE